MNSADFYISLSDKETKEKLNRLLSSPIDKTFVEQVKKCNGNVDLHFCSKYILPYIPAAGMIVYSEPNYKPRRYFLLLTMKELWLSNRADCGYIMVTALDIANNKIVALHNSFSPTNNSTFYRIYVSHS
jgi:hypothetical protein